VVAVAHLNVRSQSVLVKLFDAASGKLLIDLDGPTLPVRALAFSGSRPLLAAAGDDGTVSVWSLKGASRVLPTIEGLLVTERAGEVVVTAVQPGTSAAAKLKVGDVIESVADAKGAQKPVKAPFDLVLTVRGLKVGDNAQVKVKGQPAVAVAVGTMTGFRHPLFTLWVDPLAKAGRHDWIGWTASGPYDTNSEAAEARIGWLTATGIPARPVTYAPAEEYRKLYYKRDFIRLLVEKADYNDALAALPQPRRPVLEATLKRAPEVIDGRPVVRETPDGLSVALNDPDSVLDLERVNLRWQLTGPGGTTEWVSEPFGGARAVLNLSKYAWKRGEHSIHIKLFKTGAAPADAVLVDEVTVGVGYIPPAPELSVKIDTKVPTGAEITTENETVEVAATVDAKPNPDGAGVSVSWTGGGEPVELRRNADGSFGPHKIKLKPGEAVAVMVTATNRGTGVKPELESHTAEARVRRLQPKQVPPPGVKLLVVTPYDFRIATEQPYVVSTQKVFVTATVFPQAGAPVTEFEWQIGGAVEAGKLDAKTNSQTREIELPLDKALTLRVRAKSKDSPDAFDSAEIRYDGLPEVSVTMPPEVVTAPELNLSGGLKVVSKRPFKVRVLVTSAQTGRSRVFDPTPDPALTKWQAGVTLFPGVNQLGYVVSYDEDRKELRRAGLIDVRYVRPPSVVGAGTLDVGTGTTGAVNLAVLSAPDAPPSELWINGARVGFRASDKPVRFFGAAFWPLRADGVAVRPGADRLKPVAVMVRNAEQGSAPINLEVIGREEVKRAPPVLHLTRNGAAIGDGQELPPVGEAAFKLSLKATSETRFTKLELWHEIGGAPGDAMSGVKLADAVAGPDGFTLAALPEVRLRPGADNRIRVVATNESGSTEVAFRVSYTPPAVRVLIDSIKEPNGAVVPVVPGSAGALAVSSPVIEVSGRVEWDFDNDPLARDNDLAVVFVANGVAHLPVTVSKANPGARERKFTGRVYLNALDPNPAAPGLTNVRVELRSGGRPMAVPQSALSRARFAVTSTAPLRKQRLHLLVLGVGVPESQRKQLISNVIAAVGGTVPAGSANFTAGRFERPGFDFAYLYAPRLDYTKSGDLNALLNAVRADIEERTQRASEEWVNDVIVVYYQGADWVNEKGWFLHSATTLSGSAGKDPSRSAIRLDNLPLVPGLPVAVLNVNGKKMEGDDLAVTVSYLRTAWGDTAETVYLLPQLAEAIRRGRTFEDVVSFAGAGLSKGAQKPVEWMPKFAREIRERYVGVLKP
jgi:hypothetical protein